MKIPLVYGLLMAVVGALLMFGLFVAGFHETPDKLAVVRWPSAGVSIIASIVLLALSMHGQRAEYPANKEWSYGSAVGTGVLTALWASLFSAVVSYVYFAYVNPQFGDVVYQLQVQTMQAKGMPAARVDAAEKMMRMMLSPIPLTIIQLLQSFIALVVTSLVVAIFVRKPTATAGLVAEPHPMG
jgi:hypothetical protein